MEEEQRLGYLPEHGNAESPGDVRAEAEVALHDAVDGAVVGELEDEGAVVAGQWWCDGSVQAHDMLAAAAEDLAQNTKLRIVALGGLFFGDVDGLAREELAAGPAAH